MTTRAGLTTPQFDALFDTFTSSVARLEALPAYAVGGAEQVRIEAYRDRRPRPLRNVRTAPWLARIATSTVAGKRWTRVRVVDDPMTDYQRYRIAGDVEGQAVGEDVWVARRALAGDVGPDCWLFDDRLVVLMHYDAAGRIARREPVDDPAVVAECARRLADVRSVAVPLNEFLVGLDG